jgi:hypothetical protein
MTEDTSRLSPPPQARPTKPPSSALLVNSLPPPIPALQRLLDQGAAKRRAAEPSANKTAKYRAEEIPSFATKVFPQLPYLRTQRSSCIELAFYSEKTRAERQADFHRRLCARLEEVQRQQENLQEWLAMRLEAGLSLPPDHPTRSQYINANGSPLLPSQIEVLDDEVDEDDEDGASLSPPKQLELPWERTRLDETAGSGSDCFARTEQQGSPRTSWRTGA